MIGVAAVEDVRVFILHARPRLDTQWAHDLNVRSDPSPPKSFPEAPMSGYIICSMLHWPRSWFSFNAAARSLLSCHRVHLSAFHRRIYAMLAAPRNAWCALAEVGIVVLIGVVLCLLMQNR